MCIVDVFIGLSIADGTGHPAQTVIVPGADVGMFSLCIGRLLIHRLTEYVAGALQLSSVPVDMQGQVALLVIPEGLCIAQLVNSLADLAETVVTVLHCIAVAVYSPADLPGGGVFIAFLHPVHKANACDASPAVHVIGNGILVAVHNSDNLASGIILILLEDALMVQFRIIFTC